MGAAVDSGRLLDALDPEQREVAEALRGPVRVLAGAGTGKTRAITHRIAYGVATGTYNPAEVLAVTFTTRAAGEMRASAPRAGRSGSAGAHVPLGRPASGALVLAEGLRRRAAAADRVEDPGRRRRGPPQPHPGRPGHAARPGERDRVGQGQQRPPRRLRAPRSRTRPRGGRSGRRLGGARVRHLRGAQARAGPDGHGGRPAHRCRPARRGRPRRRDRAPAVQVVRRRRVPGRQPDPGDAAGPLARRSRRDLRGRRPGADDLLLRGRPGGVPHRVHPRRIPAPPASSWSATTARPRR